MTTAGLKWPYLATAGLMRPSIMEGWPTPGLICDMLLCCLPVVSVCISVSPICVCISVSVYLLPHLIKSNQSFLYIKSIRKQSVVQLPVAPFCEDGWRQITYAMTDNWCIEREQIRRGHLLRRELCELLPGNKFRGQRSADSCFKAWCRLVWRLVRSALWLACCANIFNENRQVANN